MDTNVKLDNFFINSCQRARGTWQRVALITRTVQPYERS